MSKNFWEENSKPWSEAIQSQLLESRKTTNPAIIAAIAEIKPQSVLDLGCGEGWIASRLVRLGVRYTGVDFSTPLVKIARATYPGAVFEAASYEEIIDGSWKPSQAFDLAVFNFSLFSEDLRPLLKKTISFLNPRGSVVIQTLHPRVSLDPYCDGWRTEDFKSFPVPFSGTMRWYGRTIESWEKSFTESGLQLTEAKESFAPGSSTPLSMIFILQSL